MTAWNLISSFDRLRKNFCQLNFESKKKITNEFYYFNKTIAKQKTFTYICHFFHDHRQKIGLMNVWRAVGDVFRVPLCVVAPKLITLSLTSNERTQTHIKIAEKMSWHDENKSKIQFKACVCDMYEQNNNTNNNINNTHIVSLELFALITTCGRLYANTVSNEIFQFCHKRQNAQNRIEEAGCCLG